MGKTQGVNAKPIPAIKNSPKATRKLLPSSTSAMARSSLTLRSASAALVALSPIGAAEGRFSASTALVGNSPPADMTNFCTSGG